MGTGKLTLFKTSEGKFTNTNPREGKRGGGELLFSICAGVLLIQRVGLKAQHVSGIKFLAEATEAELIGCTVGSKALQFQARLSPLNLADRNIKIEAKSAASVLLVFQSILPFLLFARDDIGSPIIVTIDGGSNVNPPCHSSTWIKFFFLP